VPSLLSYPSLRQGQTSSYNLYSIMTSYESYEAQFLGGFYEFCTVVMCTVGLLRTFLEQARLTPSRIFRYAMSVFTRCPSCLVNCSGVWEP